MARTPSPVPAGPVQAGKAWAVPCGLRTRPRPGCPPPVSKAGRMLAHAAPLRRGRLVRAPKPSPSPTPGSAGNQGFRLPPRSVRTRRRSARSAPPGVPSAIKPAAKTAFATREIEAGSDPSNRRTLRKHRSPRPTPVSRPRNRSEPRSLEPPDRHESLDARSDPFRNSRGRSEPRPVEPPDAAQGASPFRRHPIRDPRNRSELRSLEPPDLSTKAETLAPDPFESGSGRSLRRLHLRPLAPGAGPSRAWEGRPWPAPESAGRGPCRIVGTRGDSRILPHRHVASPRTILADRLGSAGSSRRCDRRLALPIPPTGRNPRVRRPEHGPPFEGEGRVLSALAGGCPVRPLRAFPSVHEEEAVTLYRVAKADSACG